MTPEPSAAPAATSLKRVYGLPVLTGGLLYVSFFPLNLGFVAWIALVPLLTLLHAVAKPRQIYFAAWFGGLAFYVPALQWVRVAHPAMYGTWAALSVICAFYFPIAIALLRALERRGLPLMLSLPTVWVGLEYVRAHFPTGFAWMEPLGIQHRIGFGWYFMGYTQHDFSRLIQISDITGVYGVSFLVCLVNAAVYQALRPNRSPPPEARRSWLPLAVAVVCVSGAVLYGNFRFDAEQAPGPRVALLQSDVPQSVKMSSQAMLAQHMVMLLNKARDVPPEELPDLIVWPETTCGEDWTELAPGYTDAPLEQWVSAGQSLTFAKKMGAYWGANQLLGLNGIVWEGPDSAWKYNSAKMINRDGTPGPRYDKMHLVPFGEYVPLEEWFPWLQAFTPYTGRYSCKPGENWTRFPLKVGDRTYHFGTIICYEDSDPALARRYVLPDPQGPPVDFVANISNDGWFNGTEEHEQHLAICRFRAVECRRAIVRAVNMGISCIIDGNGQIVALPGPTWAQSVKVATVVNGVVPIDHRTSWYARLGDWLPLACWGTVILAFVLTLIRRRTA